MFICIDFDGTIVDHAYPVIGEPVPNAIKWMKRFNELGGDLILFTMRSGKHLSEAVTYVEDNGIQLFGANNNPTQREWTNSPKVYGHVYIDDAAACCPLIFPVGFNRPCVDWNIVGPYVERMLW